MPLPHLPKQWVHRPLMTFTFQFYASETYVKEHGYPRAVHELAKHRLLLPNPPQWPLLWQEEDDLKGIYLSTLSDLKTLALWDYGLALLPHEVETQGLIHVPVLTTPPTIDLYYSYPDYRKASSRVMAFYNHLENPLVG